MGPFYSNVINLIQIEEVSSLGGERVPCWHRRRGYLSTPVGNLPCPQLHFLQPSVVCFSPKSQCCALQLEEWVLQWILRSEQKQQCWFVTHHSFPSKCFIPAVSASVGQRTNQAMESVLRRGAIISPQQERWLLCL